MAEVKKKAKSSKLKAKSASKEVKTKKKAGVIFETATVEAAPDTKVEEMTAKAGKRSPKAIKEVEEKQAKASRKAAKSAEASSEGEKASGQVKKPPRSRLERAGKKYRDVVKLIDEPKTYSLSEALDLATRTNPAKFDATVELHINLGIDPKQADQNVRGTVILPAGSGKSLRVAALCQPGDETKAKSAGADLVGEEAILTQLDRQEINFEVLIASPSMMPKLSKHAKLLGPKGLMPNPKSGTVSADVVKAVQEARAGKIEFRADAAGIVHLIIGKVSFGPSKLLQNANAVLASLQSAKPASLKGVYLKSMFAATTMGPSIKIST